MIKIKKLKRKSTRCVKNSQKFRLRIVKKKLKNCSIRKIKKICNCLRLRCEIQKISKIRKRFCTNKFIVHDKMIRSNEFHEFKNLY